MFEIISRADAMAQGKKKYFNAIPCQRGHVCEMWVYRGCVECCRMRERERKKAKRAADPDFYAVELERNREYQREHAKKFPEKHAAKVMKRRAAKHQATPAWLTKQHIRKIEGFYAEAARLTKDTGINHNVDHVVPILGRFIWIDGVKVREVCGLHVPWNLQVIPAIDNMRKHNKLLEAA